MDEINQLKKNGFCILSGVFNNLEINQMRDEVIAHLKNMAKTQNREQSYHLAGFHRYPSLFRLHSNLISNQRINVALKNFYGAEDYITIGLSALKNQKEDIEKEIEKKMKKSFDKVKKHYLTQSNVGKGFDD